MKQYAINTLTLFHRMQQIRKKMINQQTATQQANKNKSSLATYALKKVKRQIAKTQGKPLPRFPLTLEQ